MPNHPIQAVAVGRLNQAILIGQAFRLRPDDRYIAGECSYQVVCVDHSVLHVCCNVQPAFSCRQLSGVRQPGGQPFMEASNSIQPNRQRGEQAGRSLVAPCDKYYSSAGCESESSVCPWGEADASKKAMTRLTYSPSS